jgi:hypothetical protein
MCQQRLAAIIGQEYEPRVSFADEKELIVNIVICWLILWLLKRRFKIFFLHQGYIRSRLIGLNVGSSEAEMSE